MKLLWAILLAGAAVSAGAQAPARRPAQAGPRHTVAPPAVAATQYKGIFEPMNYPDDLRLNSVFFVNDSEGWIGADHGILIHTSDGGKTWQPQIGGDINSTESPISAVWFLDRLHGWANQANRLLHTRDGQHWTQTGTLPADAPFVFISERTGIHVNWDGIRLTRDGGRTWRMVAQCSAKLPVNGLVQTVGCQPSRLFFVSQRVGYVVGMSGGELGALLVLKTTDGGYTWTTMAVPNVAPWAGADGLFFITENVGYVRINDGKLWTTSDGGRTWHGIAGTTIPGAIRFADPELGWSFNGQSLSYTSDGGHSWTARGLRFPAAVRDYSLPRRDIAYVIGEHGMIYRYHVVPYDYEVANAVQAPAMPGYNVAVNAQIVRIRRDIVALQAKLNPKLVAAGLPPVTATPTGAAPGATDGTASGIADAEGVSAADAVATSDALAAASAGGSDASGSSPVPSVTAAAAGAADTSPSGVSADAAAAASSATTDFAEPPSPAVQNCCAAEVQQLQTDVGTFQQQLPAATTQWRTLNLIIAGIRMAQDLLGKADAFKTTLIAFKKAPNLQSAASVLQDFIAKYNGVRQEIAGGFQNPPPIPESDSATPAGGGTAAVAAAQPGAAPDASAGVAAVDAGSANVPQSAQQPADQSQAQSSQASGPVTATADKQVQKVEDKVKKKVGKWIPH